VRLDSDLRGMLAEESRRWLLPVPIVVSKSPLEVAGGEGWQVASSGD
jgi:hypothetical protein